MTCIYDLQESETSTKALGDLFSKITEVTRNFKVCSAIAKTNFKKTKALPMTALPTGSSI